ncbi:putative drug exporter of the RND superfamily [Propionibacterium cyclohexanicum]|uniref:Putative drug exporter of the RND superfamily n=1 Tax=Propionibacterium cyclohexanicum TaxID=64702 RepID=A0A1H9U0V9_9ACTN|nr:MMPL family transporter [Propionibacterium cyclohexanicum]SES02999.1 putative drug exporter of the RND superfamily [Propionibacterium cyclohexanicum]
MFSRIGRTIARHPLTVVIAWALALGILASFALFGWGHGGLFERLTSADSSVPGTQSQQVIDLTTSDPGAAKTATLVFTGVDVAGHSKELAGVLAQHREDLRVEHVASETDAFSVPDPRSPQAQALLSKNGDGFVMVLTLDEGLSAKQVSATSDAIDAAMHGFVDNLRQSFPQASGHQVSTDTIGTAISNLVRNDLVRGESVGLPVALLLLVIVFGGLLAACLPLVGALTAIGIGLGVMWAVTFAMDINSFIINVVSIIGLALSIDYGLLVVSRYREEIAAALRADGRSGEGDDLPEPARMRELVREAVTRTVSTAGRTVSYSALTIACALAGLFVMRSSILKMIAAGGVAVTLLAVMTAVSLVPAMITLLGAHLVRPSWITRVPGLRRALRTVGDASSDQGVFSKLAHRVIAHPWLFIVAVVAIMGLMASPISSLSTRSSFADYIPAGTSVRTGYDTLQRDYPALATPDITVIADAVPTRTGGLVNSIKAIDGVENVQVQPLPRHDSMTQISIAMDSSDPVGPKVISAVHDVRALNPGFQVWVGGSAAGQIDFDHSLVQGAPAAITIVVLAVFILLFAMTGSIIVPLKALVINVFSLIASLGTTWWLFQHGHLGLPQVNGLESFIVACMLAFGFGLAMDYEVFLLARIKEYWDLGHDNDEAVARGLQRSGRIITSAAAIIIAVFLGFVSGQMMAIKQIGVALAITVATDATLVRMLLVPSTMTVLGKWNWWAPGPLQALYKRIGLHE